MGLYVVLDIDESEELHRLHLIYVDQTTTTVCLLGVLCKYIDMNTLHSLSCYTGRLMMSASCCAVSRGLCTDVLTSFCAGSGGRFSTTSILSASVGTTSVCPR